MNPSSPLHSIRRAGALALMCLVPTVLAGCAIDPPAPGTPLGTHPLAIFQSTLPAPVSGNVVQRQPPQTVGSVQQREAFATLETYVTLLARSNALDNQTCQEASDAAARELRGMPPPEPALRLALIAGCPAASAGAVRLAIEELGRFAGRVEASGEVAGGEDAGALAVPAPIAALAGVWRDELERRLGLVARLTRDRASVAEYEVQVASLREQVARAAAERQAGRRARERLGRELVLTRESLAAAREKLEAVSRIERAVQQAGEAVDVQSGWAEMAPPGAGDEAPAVDGAPAADEAPAAAEAPAAGGAPAADMGPAAGQRPPRATNKGESPASRPATSEES